MAASPRILVINADAARTSEVESRLAAKGLRPIMADLDNFADNPNTDAAVLVLPAQMDFDAARRLEGVVAALSDRNVASIVWGSNDAVGATRSPMFDCCAADVSIDEVIGRLSVVARYAPLLKRMQRELNHLQALSTQLNRYFTEIDQEMRLAGRLQRDFLPERLPEPNHYRIRTIYRPASWVSGDTYDAKRIDDRHLGIFVADAMGHGVAAGLITMFMQQALLNKEMHDDVVRVIRPPEVLTRLHYCLCRQQLPSCQFVTAVYATIDTARHSVRVSRAGHPYPILLTADGEIREVTPEGGLLGLPDIDPDFEEQTVRLGPGERLVVYTDGLEDVIIAEADANGEARFTDLFRSWREMNADQMIGAIEQHLDNREGSLNPADDITVMVIEHMKSGEAATH